jgi:hypothetical protein
MPAITTKPEIILKLVSRKSGATPVQLGEATGWMPHSVRAALSALRKKGHEITHYKNMKGVTVYSIADGESK